MTKEELIERLLANGFYKATIDIVKTKHNPYGIRSIEDDFNNNYKFAYFYDYLDDYYLVFDFYSDYGNRGKPNLTLYDYNDGLVEYVYFESGDYDGIWGYFIDD